MGRVNLEVLKKLEGSIINKSPSQAGNWLSPTLKSIDKGKIVMAVQIRKEMCNPYGNIHGGMMSVIIDEAIGWAIISLEPQGHYTSMTLNIDFLYAAAEGETIIAVAEIVRHGKKVINAEVKVYNESNTLLSKASSNLVITGMKVKN